MTEHLIAVALGPVQDFIAQARRSRDLWNGSHILSELARAVAAELAKTHGARLIFPALEGGDPELAPSDGPRRDSQRWALAVSNKVLAVLPDGVSPDTAATAAIHAARRRWRSIAKAVFGKSESRDLIDARIWKAEAEGTANISSVWSFQVENLLEIYAAWQPLSDHFNGDREALDRAISARKTLRDFGQQPSEWQRAGAPKSSFDGGRVSVLKASAVRDPAFSAAAGRFRIPGAENLDAVGLIKRCGGKPKQFVPIANVGLASWLQAARREPHTAQLLDDLGADPIAQRFGSLDPHLAPHAELLRVDAQCLIPSRYPGLFKDAGVTDKDEVREDTEYLETIYARPVQKAVSCVTGRRSGKPPAYVGVIVADGDYMGALIERLSSRQGEAGLRAFSEALGSFAAEARAVVSEHLGSLIYAGGDDVLAFVPLQEAFACADALRLAFEACMTPVSQGEVIPRLSVGLGIGHFLAGMAALLDLGRAAERLAKSRHLPEGEQRNALAVILDKRSGGRLSWRRRWDHAEPPREAFRAATARVRPMDGAASVRIPITKLYQTRRDLSRLPAPQDGDAAWSRILAADLQRTLNRRDGMAHKAPRSLTDFGLAPIEGLAYPDARRAVDEWFARHIIAKEVAAATFLPKPTQGDAP